MTDQFEKGYALLIGVDENHVPDWALPGVARDVAALSGVLTHPQRCAYPGDNVKVLTGQAATRQGILDGLAWLQERVQSPAGGDATALIYYSGHGWRDQDAAPPDFYLIPCDVRQGQVRARALRAADFAEAVAGLQPGRLLVVMDCCHAAGMGLKDASRLAAGYAAAAIPPGLLMAGQKEAAEPGGKGLEALAQGQGRAVLSSSSGAQPSYMRRDGQMSIFTYHLIEALTGHAQPGEGATEVLVSDVMGHVWRHVPRSARADWGADQTPDYQVSGNFPIALLLGGQPWSKGQLAPDPLAEFPPAGASQGLHQVNTGGGAFIAGSVKVEGGDFVGRDQVIYGDKLRGDKAGGEG